MNPTLGSFNPTQSSLNPRTQRPNSYFYGNSEEIINGYFTTPTPNFSAPEPEQGPEPNPAPGIQIIPEPTFSLSTTTQVLKPTQIPQIASQVPTVPVSYPTLNPGVQDSDPTSSPTLQSSYPTLQPFTSTHIPVHQSPKPTRIPSFLSSTPTQLPSSPPTELPFTRLTQLPSPRPTQLPSSRTTQLPSTRPTKLQDISLPPGPRVKKNSHISTTLTPHLSHSSIFQQFGDLVSVNISTYGEPKIKPKNENDDSYDDDDDDEDSDDKKSSPPKYSISRNFNIDPIDQFKFVEDRIDVSEEKETYTVNSGSVKIKNWENPNPILNPMQGLVSTPNPKSIFESNLVPNIIKSTPVPNMINYTPVPNMIKSTLVPNMKKPTPVPNMIKYTSVPNMIKSSPGFNPILISTTQGFSPTYPTTAATALYRTEPPTTDLPTTIMSTTNSPTTTATTVKTTSIRDAIYAKKRRPTKPALIKSTTPTAESSNQDEKMTISEVTKLTSEPVVSSWSPLQRGLTTTSKPGRGTTKPAWLR